MRDPSIRMFEADDVAAARRRIAGQSFDAILIDITLPGALQLIAELSGRASKVPVLAIAGEGLGRRTLEYSLTLAELRGAALGLPKPIDMTELAVAAIGLVAGGDPRQLAAARFKAPERRPAPSGVSPAVRAGR